jgi:anti-anti-sigma regulatory factor
MTINETLTEALANLDTAAGEVTLDFSAVSRIDAGALRALDALIAAAGAKAVKVSLSGVNVTVYKVLKLTNTGPLTYSSPASRSISRN